MPGLRSGSRRTGALQPGINRLEVPGYPRPATRGSNGCGGEDGHPRPAPPRPSSNARRRTRAASRRPPSARTPAGPTPGRSAASTLGSPACRLRTRPSPRTTPTSTTRAGRRPRYPATGHDVAAVASSPGGSLGGRGRRQSTFARRREPRQGQCRQQNHGGELSRRRTSRRWTAILPVTAAGGAGPCGAADRFAGVAPTTPRNRRPPRSTFT